MALVVKFRAINGLKIDFYWQGVDVNLMGGFYDFLEV